MSPYNPRTYLGDRFPLIAIAVACCLGAFAMGKILGLGTQPAIAIAAFIGTCSIFGFVVDYLRGRRFFQESSDLVEHIDSAYQFPSLVKRPRSLEARIAYDLCADIARLDAEELTHERASSSESQEFFELWVHEVKTPLAASRLILSRMHGEDALNLRRELDRIDTSCERALYSARIANVATDYQITETPLLPVCREACRDLASLMIEKGVKPQFAIPEDLTAPTDRQWMKFIVKQALTNSVKYGATTVTFSAETLEPDTPQGRTELRIADDGLGIPESDMPNVFRQGFSGTNGREDGTSTGMGLYLAAQTCAAMGVGLSLTSEENKGTVVVLSIPHNRDALNMTKS